MQHSSYPEEQYRSTGVGYGILVYQEPDKSRFTFIVNGPDGVAVKTSLSLRDAARLAGFILSKHPAIINGDALAFATVTRACDGIPEPDFTVITPGHELIATAEEQDTQDDDQGTKGAPADTGITKDDQDTGDLHPDQERRLTALREASKILGGRLGQERLIEWAGWILAGDTPTN